MFGWRGQLLRVDLDNGSITKEPLSLDVAREYLGGRGLGAYLHGEEVPGSIAPLSAENHLIFITGPLTGTLAPNGGRYTVVTRTPPTGEVSAASISGKWGSELKFAGFDGIIIEGKAAEPVYLWIKNGKAELRSAAHLAGRTVSDTTEALIGETDARAVVACIGPAGENEVNCSVIVSDYFSAAGGCGAGAVMGSKNLKAVVVCGTEGFRVADRDKLLKSANELRSHMKTRPIAAKGSLLHDSVLVADSMTWDPEPPELKHARTRGCFSCATCFSSFTYGDGKEYLPLLAGATPFELGERMKEYRHFLDLGLDYAAAKSVLTSLGKEVEGSHTELARKMADGQEFVSKENRSNGQNIDRGPCMVAGYAIVPKITAGNGQDEALTILMSVLDSVSLCPFLASGIGLEKIAELLTHATGVPFTPDEMAQAGQRISWVFRN
ncbi:MAG TPA: aldehyde ferredoxin oxidoreductase N-terminal domain-containing protein [Acidobacteriota bacterium]|nr:aldehyde ferredoxin oxidoreductase N-terminal domain-containing protein [Acidobacteriota bacterium]